MFWGSAVAEIYGGATMAVLYVPPARGAWGCSESG